MNRVVLLLGAGASARSGGPTHEQFVKTILDGAAFGQEAAARLTARQADPFDLVRSGDIPEAQMVALLERALGDLSRPNVVHRAAAAVLAAGGAVWTGNYDELIEMAAVDADVEYHRIGPGGDLGCSCDQGHLLKPYGTISGDVRQSFVDVVPPEWSGRLAADFTGAYAAVFGYSGRDSALREALVTAISRSEETLWFSLASDREPALDYVPEAWFREVSVDRCTSFIEWCITHGIAVDEEDANQGSSPERLIVIDESKRLVDVLRADPEALHGITWRQFEVVTAELLTRAGYGVELTRGSKDGGVDVFAWTEDPFFGRIDFLVQCKHYQAPHLVEEGDVRELYGLVHAHHAAKGILVTSSMFTRGAQAFAELFRQQLSLRNHLEVKEWLRNLGASGVP